MATTTLTTDNFEQTITENDIVLLDFWASWCGPCRMFGPVFEEASEKNPDMVFAVPDHAVSSEPGRTSETTELSSGYMKLLREETSHHGIRLFDLGEPGQGIVHVIGPEMGISLPGSTVVCGDSHTCTHGALGAMAWGIGSSELLHVLATQTLPQKPKRSGSPPAGCPRACSPRTSCCT